MFSILSAAMLVKLAVIPAHIQESIDKAIATNDPYILDAVAYRAQNENPNYADGIRQYIQDFQQTASQPVAIDAYEAAYERGVQQLSPASGHDNTSVLDGWEGEVEGGLLIQTGNSENENLNGAVKFEKEIGVWEHRLKASAANNSSDNVRSAEEYRANAKSNYGISPMNYVFGELDWVKDRYSGYNYRLAEYVGYGHKYYDTETLELSAEAALGMQQSKEEGQDSENNFVQKIAGDLEWDINDNLTFSQHLAVEHASGVFFSLSETALSTKISEELALKLGYNMEHISEVPANTDKLDTKTMVNVLYEFE